jgi:hypothetical protein
MEELPGPALGTPTGVMASVGTEDPSPNSILKVELTGLCGRLVRDFLWAERGGNGPSSIWPPEKVGLSEVGWGQLQNINTLMGFGWGLSRQA